MLKTIKMLGILGVLTISCIYAKTNNNCLNIGDKMPNVLMTRIVDGKEVKISIEDFKGKLLIMDMWATWCSPCRSFLKIADSLQKQFKGQIEILPVTDEDKNFIRKFQDHIKKATGLNIMSVVNGKNLQSLFKFNTVPHEIWIDSQGIIRAITSHNEVTEKNINNALNKNFNLPIKKDTIKNEPVGKDNENSILGEMQDEIIYSSEMARYKDGDGTGAGFQDNAINVKNGSILSLYEYAFGKFQADYIAPNRVVLEVIDSSKFVANSKSYLSWLIENGYRYKLQVKDATMKDFAFQKMQNDLNLYFSKQGIQGRLENRMTTCWVLQRTSTIDKIGTKGGEPLESSDGFNRMVKNESIKTFLSRFQFYYLQMSKHPIVDGTNYKGNVDIDITCKLSDIDAINKELEKYDLKLVKKEFPIDMVVISQKEVKQK